MRILIFNWKDLRHPAAGGAEVYTHEIAKAWVSAGHEVTIFAARVRDAPATEHVDGVRIVRGGGRIGVYRAGRRFYAREGPGRFDLVIDEVNTKPFACPGFVRDAPVVALIFQLAVEMWDEAFPWPLGWIGRRWLEPAWLRPYSGVPVLTISASSKRSLESVGLRDVHLVPVGLEVAPPQGVVKEDRPTVVFVGRLAHGKRPHDVLRAFEIAQRDEPDLQLWMVGTGPLESKVRRSAGPGVTVFGRGSEGEKLELLARAHVLAVTSIREGWGLVVSEAAAVGTPSVAYAVPGLVDSVGAAGGTLVDQSPAALARGLLERVRDRDAEAGAPLPTGTVDWPHVATAVLRTAVAATADDGASGLAERSR